MSHEPFLLENPRTLQLALDRSIIAGISTRNGGASLAPYKSLNLGLHVGDKPEHVVENRGRLANDIGFSLDSWVCAEQVHGSVIQKVTQEDCGKGARDMTSAVSGTDGFYTREPGVLLALGYADCVPLYFFAKSESVVGIAHAGWRGTTENIARKMIDAWVRDEHLALEDIHVVIGPSIGSCCYEVDERVKDAVDTVLDGDIDGVYEEIGDGHFRLDLKKCNKKLCVKAGISENHIECSSYCTGCHPETFYSHRVEGGPTGRMLGFIGLKNE